MLELWTKRLGGDLSSDGHLARGRIGSDEFHLIDLDRGASAIAQGFLDLFGDVHSLGAADREGAHQARKILDRDLIGKVDTRQACRGQQLCKTAFGLTGLDWNSV